MFVTELGDAFNKKIQQCLNDGLNANLVHVCRHEQISKPSADNFLWNLKFPQIGRFKFSQL